MNYSLFDNEQCVVPEHPTAPKHTIDQWFKQESPPKKPKIEERQETPLSVSHFIHLPTDKGEEDKFWIEALPILEIQLAQIEKAMTVQPVESEPSSNVDDPPFSLEAEDLLKRHLASHPPTVEENDDPSLDITYLN